MSQKEHECIKKKKKPMPTPAGAELTFRNVNLVLIEYSGFRMFINLGKTTYFSSLEPGLSNPH